MKNHVHPAPGSFCRSGTCWDCAGLSSRASLGCSLLWRWCHCPFVPQFPSAHRFWQAGVPHLSSGAGPALWDPQVKNPLLLHPPFIRGAQEVEKAPVGPGKERVGASTWEREAVHGLLPSTSVLGSCCSPGNVPFHTSPELVPGCAWVGFLPRKCLPTARGWLSVPHHLPLQGSFPRRDPWAGFCQGTETYQPGAFHFPKPSSWMAKLVVPQSGWGS